MIDVMTQEPIRVSTDGSAGPYIMVPVSQLDEMRRLLDSRAVRYWVEEDVISVDGSPEVGVVNLGRGADAGVVQSILDQAS